MVNAKNKEFSSRLDELEQGLSKELEAKVVRTREAVLRVSQTLKGLLDWKSEHRDDFEKVKQRVELLFKERARREQELMD